LRSEASKDHRRLLKQLLGCYNRDPSITALIECLSISKREFYNKLKELRDLYEIFFVPNPSVANLAIAEVVEPKRTFGNVRTFIDLAGVKRAYFFVPLPADDIETLRVLKEILKTLIEAHEVHIYKINAVCYEEVCILPTKVSLKPAWGEILISGILTEKLILPKEIAEELKPLTSWQRATYLLRGVLRKRLVIGPVFRTKDKSSLTVLMDIKYKEEGLTLRLLNKVPFWIEDSLIVLKDLEEKKRYSLIFSIKPYYLEQVMRLNDLEALPYKILRTRTFFGGTRITPSAREILNIDNKPAHFIEVLANTILSSHKRRSKA
jgi:hypothetical protein